jgi:hypothetical protein
MVKIRGKCLQVDEMIINPETVFYIIKKESGKEWRVEFVFGDKRCWSHYKTAEERDRCFDQILSALELMNGYDESILNT